MVNISTYVSGTTKSKGIICLLDYDVQLRKTTNLYSKIPLGPITRDRTLHQIDDLTQSGLSVSFLSYDEEAFLRKQRV